MLAISYSVYVWKNTAVKLCGPELYFAKRFFNYRFNFTTSDSSIHTMHSLLIQF